MMSKLCYVVWTVVSASTVGIFGARLSPGDLASKFKSSEIINGDSLAIVDPSTGRSLDSYITTDSPMPDLLTVSFSLFGNDHVLHMHKAQVVRSQYQEKVLSADVLKSKSTTLDKNAWLPAYGEENSPEKQRHRRVGPRQRRLDLDCFYHGKLANDDTSFVAVSVCTVPVGLHAAITLSNKSESFEIQPLENGQHVGYRIEHLRESNPATCGNGIHTDHDSNSASQPFWSTETADKSRTKRQTSCTKNVEVLIINDHRLFELRGEDTEDNSAQIFNAMANLYTEAGFNCNITLRLVGQLTFRHGTPDSIIQHPCNLSWYYASLPTAANNACCAASSACSCPTGTTQCLSQPATCINQTRGCHWYTRSTRTCGLKRRETITQAENDDGTACPARSTSSREVDVLLMLNSLRNWITIHKNMLESEFGGPIDNTMLFSATDFASSTIGLAGVQSMCRSSTSSSTNQVGFSTSPLRNAFLTTHEMGHNFGLRHVEARRFIMSASSSSQTIGWNSASIQSFNSIVRQSTMTCLNNAWSPRPSQVCGDGIVEGDEECDLGIGYNHTCCTSQCRLAAGCDCSPIDPCCDDNGQFLTASTVCRAQEQSQCDYEERCSGSSGQCPQDTYALAGTPCTSNPAGGMCYQGQCFAPLSCSAFRSYPYFIEDLRSTCQTHCSNRNHSSWTGGTPRNISRSVYGPDGTPCGYEMQCSTAFSVGDSGERCVPSWYLNADAPSVAPTTFAPTPPTPSPTTGMPTAPPTWPSISCGQSRSGNTATGAINLVGNSAPDHIYYFSLPSTTQVEFSTCTGTTYDSYLRVYSRNLVDRMYGLNDDACSLQSRLSLNLQAGSYSLVVEGYSSSSGAYTVQMNCISTPTASSSRPTSAPATSTPSNAPSAYPSLSPSTRSPTRYPSTSVPSNTPSSYPSLSPSTTMPTRNPLTSLPSSTPSVYPSLSPVTSFPTAVPTTAIPSTAPSQSPSTSAPSSSPSTSNPTVTPTIPPSLSPPKSISPTLSPVTSSPSKQPTTSVPTAVPYTSSPSTPPKVLEINIFFRLSFCRDVELDWPSLLVALEMNVYELMQDWLIIGFDQQATVKCDDTSMGASAVAKISAIVPAVTHADTFVSNLSRIAANGALDMGRDSSAKDIVGVRAELAQLPDTTTSTTSSTDDGTAAGSADEDNKLFGGSNLYIFIGAAGLLALVFVLCCCCWCRARSRRADARRIPKRNTLPPAYGFTVTSLPEKESVTAPSNGFHVSISSASSESLSHVLELHSEKVSNIPSKQSAIIPTPAKRAMLPTSRSVPTLAREPEQTSSVVFNPMFRNSIKSVEGNNSNELEI